ncbi:hypothetical protein WE668_005156, partial [Escherichia coli H23]
SIVIRKIINLFRLFLYGDVVSYNFEMEENRRIIVSGSLTKRDNIPKIIWIYWHDEQIPLLIEACIKRLKDLNPNYQLNVLNKFTIHEYLPESLMWRQDLSVQIRSDLIRLGLLYKFGGVWIDASVMFFEDLSWLERLSAENKYDLIGFYRGRLSIDCYNPIVESWMLGAPKYNKFIKRWYDNFYPVSYLGLDEYFNTIKKRSDYKIIKQNINIPKYLSVYLAQQISSREMRDYCAYLRKVEDSAYLYQESYPQRDCVLSEVWCKRRKPQKIPPLIKLTSQNRNTILACSKINPRSIVGEFLDNKN